MGVVEDGNGLGWRREQRMEGGKVTRATVNGIVDGGHVIWKVVGGGRRRGKEPKRV